MPDDYIVGIGTYAVDFYSGNKLGDIVKNGLESAFISYI